MRLLVLNWRDWQHPWAGGAETLLREIVIRLVGRGHAVTLLCQRGPGQSARAVLGGVQVVRNGSGLLHTALAPWWLVRHQQEFDLIWEFTNKVPYGGPLFARRPLIAAAMHVNGATAAVELGGLGWAFAALERTLYRLYRATPFVTISESTRSELAALGVRPENVAVVRCGVAEDYLCTPIAPKAADPTVVCVSRLKKYKRLDLLIRAMPLVVAALPRARLVVVGTGDQEAHLKDLTRSLGLARRVGFTGHVDEPTKRALLDEAWIQVQPSMKEGWGLTVVEAAARAVPTIAFDVPGLRDSIVDGVTGVIVRTPSSEALGKDVLRLLTDDRRRERLSRQARERAVSYSWDAASAQVEGVLLDASAVPVGGLVLRGST